MIAYSRVSIKSIHFKSIKFELINSCKLLLMLLCLISGCTFQKRYIRNDYSFYSKDFKLDNVAPLRTDGVYRSYKIETDAAGEGQKVHKEQKVYKFYPTGQVNMVIR
jgi:hypothetical protein